MNSRCSEFQAFSAARPCNKAFVDAVIRHLLQYWMLSTSYQQRLTVAHTSSWRSRPFVLLQNAKIIVTNCLSIIYCSMYSGNAANGSLHWWRTRSQWAIETAVSCHDEQTRIWAVCMTYTLCVWSSSEVNFEFRDQNTWSIQCKHVRKIVKLTYRKPICVLSSLTWFRTVRRNTA